MAEEEEQQIEEEEEEDPVDPQDTLRESCGQQPKCTKLKEIMDACTERVENAEEPVEDCTEELYDFVHCVDHCVAKNLFKRLK